MPQGKRGFFSSRGGFVRQSILSKVHTTTMLLWRERENSDQFYYKLVNTSIKALGVLLGHNH